MQLVARRLEARGVQGTNGPRFRRGVDKVVEAIDQPAHASVAAEKIDRSRGWSGHTLKVDAGAASRFSTVSDSPRVVGLELVRTLAAPRVTYLEFANRRVERGSETSA